MTDVISRMMLGGQESGMPASSLPDLLATVAQRDPRLAPLVQHLQVRLAAKENAAQKASGEDNATALPEPQIVEPAKQSVREQKLKKLAKSMLTELQILRSRNDMLADALGACHLCWGESQTCIYCSGQGHVGAYLIDPRVFEDVIGPARQQLAERPPLVKPQTINKGEEDHAGI